MKFVCLLLFTVPLTQDICPLSLPGAEGSSQGAAISGQSVQNALISLRGGGLWLVIIDIRAGGQGAGNDFGRTFRSQQLLALKGKFLLENHGIFVRGVGISAEAEVS